MAFAYGRTVGLLSGVLLRAHRLHCRFHSLGKRTTIWPFPFCCLSLAILIVVGGVVAVVVGRIPHTHDTPTTTTDTHHKRKEKGAENNCPRNDDRSRDDSEMLA